MQTVSPTQLGGYTMPPCSDRPPCAPPLYLSTSPPRHPSPRLHPTPLSASGGFNQIIKRKENVLFYWSPGRRKSEDGGRLQTGGWGGGQIKATPKTNINQLAGNRQKDIKKDRKRGASKRGKNSLRGEEKVCIWLNGSGGVRHTGDNYPLPTHHPLSCVC